MGAVQERVRLPHRSHTRSQRGKSQTAIEGLFQQCLIHLRRYYENNVNGHDFGLLGARGALTRIISRRVNFLLASNSNDNYGNNNNNGKYIISDNNVDFYEDNSLMIRFLFYLYFPTPFNHYFTNTLCQCLNCIFIFCCKISLLQIRFFKNDFAGCSAKVI